MRMSSTATTLPGYLRLSMVGIIQVAPSPSNPYLNPGIHLEQALALTLNAVKTVTLTRFI